MAFDEDDYEDDYEETEEEEEEEGGEKGKKGSNKAFWIMGGVAVAGAVAYLVNQNDPTFFKNIPMVEGLITWLEDLFKPKTTVKTTTTTPTKTTTTTPTTTTTTTPTTTTTTTPTTTTTTTPTSFSIADIVAAATTLKTQLDKGTMPNTVQLAGVSTDIYTFLWYMSCAITNIVNKVTTNMTAPKGITAPNIAAMQKMGMVNVSTGPETLLAGNVGNKPGDYEIQNAAKSTLAFINEYNYPPAYESEWGLPFSKPETGGGAKMSIQNVIYLFAKTLVLYGTTKALPTSVPITPWTGTPKASAGETQSRHRSYYSKQV